MRTLRLSLVGAIILGLLGGLGSIVVAQSDEEPMPEATFTGVRVSSTADLLDWGQLVADGRTRGEFRDTFTWTDPRLPTEGRSFGTLDFYETGPNDGEVTQSATWLLEDPEGYWIGPWTGFGDRALIILTGHGAYEGLTAIIDQGLSCKPGYETVVVFDGFIFEGEMPPAPEPPEPTAG